MNQSSKRQSKLSDSIDCAEKFHDDCAQYFKCRGFGLTIDDGNK